LDEGIMTLKGRGENAVPNLACLACGLDIYLDETTYANYQGPVTCAQCRRQQYISIQRGELVTAQLGGNTYDAISDVVHLDIPSERLDDIAEAAFVLLQGAYKSSVVMCRRCVQGVLLALNIPDQPLGRMIEKAATGGSITQDLADQLKAIKLLGDAGAHPNDEALKEVTQTGAYLCVHLTKEVLKSVFPSKQV